MADDKFVYVRSIYGKGSDAKERYNYIPSGGMNQVIQDWQAEQPEYPRDKASPSTLLTCPRVAWLSNKGVAPINEMTWAVKQRMLLGRLFENQFADQLQSMNMLLKHWGDDPGVEVEKFTMGGGQEALAGVPDYLVKLRNELGNEIIAISDAKTSRSDNFGYVPIDAREAFRTDWGWYKYKIQLTAYFMLCHANKDWFKKHHLPLPTHCHLFSYALDDGVVRREITWKPTTDDMALVTKYTKRYNQAVASNSIPDCTCRESFEQFGVKFCRYGIKEKGSKIAYTCCSEDLAPIKEKTNV